MLTLEKLKETLKAGQKHSLPEGKPREKEIFTAETTGLDNDLEFVATKVPWKPPELSKSQDSASSQIQVLRVRGLLALLES